MFIVLDTNHFAELVHGTEPGQLLLQRFLQNETDVFTTIITAQEVTEGWSAFIRKQKAGSAKQIHGYQQFHHSLEMLMELSMLNFDSQAAAIFTGLRKTLPQAGTQDLKIASICLAHNATLLTRNIKDFKNVPDLRIENWLD